MKRLSFFKRICFSITLGYIYLFQWWTQRLWGLLLGIMKWCVDWLCLRLFQGICGCWMENWFYRLFLFHWFLLFLNLRNLLCLWLFLHDHLLILFLLYRLFFLYLTFLGCNCYKLWNLFILIFACDWFFLLLFQLC